jgi:hypothetical protein
MFTGQYAGNLLSLGEGKLPDNLAMTPQNTLCIILTAIGIENSAFPDIMHHNRLYERAIQMRITASYCQQS